jgi:hypothetical protein
VGSGKPAGDRDTGAREYGCKSRHHELPARAQSGMDRPLARRGTGAVGQLRRTCEKRDAGAHLGRYRPFRREDRRANRGTGHHQLHGDVVREFSIRVRQACGSKRRLTGKVTSKFQARTCFRWHYACEGSRWMLACSRWGIPRFPIPFLTKQLSALQAASGFRMCHSVLSLAM